MIASYAQRVGAFQPPAFACRQRPARPRRVTRARAASPRSARRFAPRRPAGRGPRAPARRRRCRVTTARLRRSRETVSRVIAEPRTNPCRSKSERRHRACASGASRPAARLPGRIERRERREIPGTDVLADVAAEQMAADRRPLRFRNRALQLDREIRDAARRIDLVFVDDRAGRTRVDAQRAGAALIGDDLVGGQLEADGDARQQHPRAELRVDEAGVLADPAKARRAARSTRSCTWCLSTKIAASNGSPCTLAHPRDQRFQPLGEHEVIVLAPRVARDRRGVTTGRRHRRCSRGRCSRPCPSRSPIARVGRKRRMSARVSADFSR